ncbi:MAG: lytic transglycosylase domain-containing protein [Thermotogae bacterium]|nr:lytic transglycosylase domain-containing protein [Thermotogota bacterium]
MRDILPILALAGVAFLLLRKPASASPSSSLPPSPSSGDINTAIKRASSGYGVPECILRGIVYAETGNNPKWFFRYHPDGVSFGAFGLTKGAVSHMGGDWNRIQRDLSYQAEMSAKYLRWLYDRLRSWDLAIQAYNIGIGNVQKGRRNYTYLTRVKRFC